MPAILIIFILSFRCSQFDDPLKKSCLDSDDQVSKTELRKKRENRHFEIQGSSTPTPATRILRSMTKTAAAVLPSSSLELQNLEVARCHKYPLVSSGDNDGSLDSSNPKNTSEMEQDRLLNSSEINFVTDENNHLSQTEEWVWRFSLAYEMYTTTFHFSLLI